jgi:hypothetical protein
MVVPRIPMQMSKDINARHPAYLTSKYLAYKIIENESRHKEIK